MLKTFGVYLFLQTTLFLRQTLSRQKFLEVLTTRPSAVRHLVSHLSQRFELSDLVDVLSGLGRYQEAGLIYYKQALVSSNGSNVESRIQRLKGVLSSPQFHGHADLNFVIGNFCQLQIIVKVIKQSEQFFWDIAWTINSYKSSLFYWHVP